MGVEGSFSCWLIGSESLLVQCAQILRDRGHEIRGIATGEPAVAAWARERDIPVVDPGGDLASALVGEFDYLFSITNLRVLPDAVLRRPRRAAINFHDGPLPRYAGLYTPAWALMAREPRYGISWHVMTAGVDEGELLAQHLFDVAPNETSLTINTKCFEAGIESFGPLCDALASGTATPLAQDLSQKAYFGKWKRPAAACALDFARPALDLEALVRALDFGRYENPLGLAKLQHRGHVLCVGAAQALEHDAGGAPGSVVAVEPDALVVATGAGCLRLSNFSRPRGQHVAAGDLAAELGLSTGVRLDGFGGELSERLEALNTELCRSEEFWVRRLAALEPVEPPYLRSDRGGSDGDWRERALDVPESFSTRFPGGDALIGAFAAWLARVSGRTSFDLAFRDPELCARIAGLEAFASDVVPLRISLDEAASAEATLAEIGAAIERTRKRRTFLHDAIARFPRLRGSTELAAGRLVPVLADLTGERAATALPAGAVLALVATPEGRSARLRFDARALDDASVEAMVAQLGVFLTSLAESPARSVATLPLLSADERRQVLEHWNATDAPYPTGACVHELFEQQVRQTPERAAASFEGEVLSYRELNARANRLAAHLRGLGIGPDRLVGVFVERSLEMLVAILAVHKAGGAYVPLDPAYPRDRIAFMLEDSGASVVLTQERIAAELPASAARVVRVDADWPAIATQSDAEAPSGATPASLAYVIYTSGSTGRPKGVMVEHGNVVNFFAGMDAKIPHDPPGVWLAVTSLSFDISVLELLWTLTRGFEVVIYAERERGGATHAGATLGPARKLDFGLFLWGSDDAPGSGKYRLMLECARFADRNGFAFVSTPERHFHAFGGPYPNPSVTSAAIAAVTEHVQIRAGSCVLPLHHPVRVAEEWAVVDNLSNGRVAISFAAGWQPNDFVVRPDGYADAKGQMFRSIDTVSRLWRGEAVEFANPLGQLVPTRTLPRPVQAELPVWVTTAGNVETYRMAGASGANVLTHLLGQTVEEVGEKVKAYRAARAEAGLDPDAGIVTLMLHTFVGRDDDEVRDLVKKPMKEYLASSVNLVKGFAWAFPAFKRPGGPDAKPEDVDLGSLSPDELDAILEYAFERYFETSGLFGTPETCAKMVERVRAVGVDEIACLVDYGVETERVLASLQLLDEVRRRANPPADARAGAADFSLAAQLEAKRVTHMQCTPSMAKMIAMNAEMRAAFAGVRHLYIGGEAFPASLARELAAFARGSVTNMYGPTETTIWSTTHDVRGAPDSIPIGRPIANTRIYLLDRRLEPVPVGVAGELFIGGDGVVRGYHHRPELTAERFLPDPFAARPGARMYRTGDLARYRSDGTIEFLGRIDHQVKIRGYRIELGEIETELGRHPAIQECVVVAREDAGNDPRLVAYFVPKGSAPATEELRDHLRETLPEFMVPALFVALDALPLTPNGKIDRKRLPAPEQHKPRTQVQFVAPRNAVEATIAEAWRDALKLESVGAEDNFFDLGGHSLLVVQVHRRLREQIPQPLSLTDLYRFPTIRSLAEYLADEGGDQQLEKSKDRAAARRESLQRRQQARRRPGAGET